MSGVASLTAESKAPARTGVIMLARHGEPALSRKVRLSAAEYRDWWARYEIGGLREGQSPPPALLAFAKDAGAIICSTRPRAHQTAQAVACEREFSCEEAFIEAPLPPPNWPSWMKLSPRAWGFIARTWWWFFDHHEGQETRRQAQVRADSAAERLIVLAEEGRDVLVMAHGFFNAMVGMSLRKRGWRLADDQGFGYWSARRYERG